jgi:hypothetical protein
MSNATVSGPFAALSKAGAHLLNPVVDGILNRFNDDATRAEAALSAVAMLQALKAMGIFYAPAPANQPAVAQGILSGSPSAIGGRPSINADIVRRLDDELNKRQSDTFERT